jgi:hypothetical protein
VTLQQSQRLGDPSETNNETCSRRGCRLPRQARVVSIPTLAFLAFLGATSTNDSGQPLEWGPKKHGLRVSLSASDKEFSLGKPILLRLVVENQGRRAVHFAFEQLHVHLSMSIEQSDGTNVPCVVPPVQTGFGRGVVLNRGERTVLFEGLDIADQYLLTSPGTYKVRFTGQDGWPGMKDMLSPSADIPASNAVTIRVADGPVKPSRLLAKELFDAAQTSGWRLEFVKEGDVVPVGRSSVSGTTLALSHGLRTKGDVMRARVWVTASPSAITPPKPGENRSSPAEALGRCPWGEVYLSSAIASPEELSTVRKLTATALEIDGR